VLGNLTGDVLGNLTGDVLGNLTGDVLGNLTGDVLGNLTGDVTGNVIANDSTLLVNSESGLLVGPLATSGLATNLNTNGRSIVSVSNQNIVIEPNGSGAIVLGKNVFLLPNTRLSVTATTAAINQVEIASFHDATDNSSNFVFSRARGTTASPQPVIDNDQIVDVVFSGFSGTGYRVMAGILGRVDGPVNSSYIPGRIEFFTTDTAGVVENRFVFKNDGTMQVNSITGNTSSLSVTGDLIGSVFSDSSTLIVDSLENKITTNSVSINQFLQLPIYADDAARFTGIPTPAQGMVIFMQTGTLPAATNQMQIFNGSNWVTL
jgi:outer membrane lipoprotein SlyB